MYYLNSFLFAVTLLLLSSNVSTALDCKLNNANPLKVAYTISVSRSGGGNFTKIQDAINFIPVNNDQWIRIQISPEIYQEKVTIPQNKPCIFLEGASSRTTKIQWGDHDTTISSPTFTSLSENVVAKGILFQNTYNVPPSYRQNQQRMEVKQALAARISGDKSVFYKCGFAGLQDTLFDDQGRHYFHQCYIEGAIDFIFGSGQSIYRNCAVNVTLKEYLPEKDYGYITAQGRNSTDDPSGFVFTSCQFLGSGKAYLGRAYGAFSRVIIVNSVLTDIVEPQGWDAWHYVEHEENIEYAEARCRGAGADTSKRVRWEKHLSVDEVKNFTDSSFIDHDGWIAKLPSVL
ncbi:hypothetical protein AB3S75_025881 [Citrus x aurantiifolia]